MKSFRVTFQLLSLIALLSLSASANDAEPPAALAPFEVILRGLSAPTFLAIDANDVVYCSEEEEGRILRVSPNGLVQVLVKGLTKPQGIAINGSGTLYIAAEEWKGTKAKGLILKRDGESLRVVSSGFKNPTGLAVDARGNIYVSAKGDKADGSKWSLFRLDAAGDVARVATGFKHPQGLVVTEDNDLLVAAERLEEEDESYGGTVFRVNLATGQMAALVGPGLKHPHSLALDRLGTLFLSAEAQKAKHGDDRVVTDDRENTDKKADRGRIIKRGPNGALQTFAWSLEDPKGLAFDRQGNLYAVEAGRGRVLRFRAPGPPKVDPPPLFTDWTPVAVTGTAAAGELLTVVGEKGSTNAVVESHGRFRVLVPLMPNASNSLQTFATGEGGQGLVSPPTAATVVHDSIPPSVRLVSPTEGATVTGTFPVEAEVADAVAGIYRVDVIVDQVLVGVANAPPYRFSLKASDFAGGRHTITVRATDRAGNQATTSVAIIVTTLQIVITVPVDGATLLTPLALVQGTIESSAPEVGMTVNGVVAQVQKPKFAALVPLAPGSNPITVTATDPLGNIATATITVAMGPAPDEQQLVLLASPASGVAPLSVSFSVLGPAAVSGFALDTQGDGTVDFIGASLEGQTFIYAQPGLYAPTVTVTDAQGTRLTATALVQVYDRSTLDALLQSKWAAMKDALRAGDIARGVSHIVTRSRSNYQAAFQIIAGRLQGIDSILTSITLIKVRNAAAIYEMTRTDAGIVKSFELRFAIDYDGIWRIEAF